MITNIYEIIFIINKFDQTLKIFLKTEINFLFSLLDTTTLNPASDIADSYFICRYGLQS